MKRGGISDPKVANIVRLNRELDRTEGLAARIRRQRNDLIRAAYTSGAYSYGTLAKAAGMTKETVAAICAGRL